MGTLKVTIGVGDPQGRTFVEIEVTVNTRDIGSTYTAVPGELLRRLGVPVERSLPSETADGRVVPVDVGSTTIRLEGLEFHTPVIFAEEGEPSLLGVVSLEEAALAVDPLAGRLIPVNLIRFQREKQMAGSAVTSDRSPTVPAWIPVQRQEPRRENPTVEPRRLHRRCHGLDFRHQRTPERPQQPMSQESHQDS